MAELLERRELLATFQQGDIVVERVGDGTAPLSASGNAVFLDEYTPAGAFVQTIALPTTFSTQTQTNLATNPLIADGTVPTEGTLSNSADGHYLLLSGFATTINAQTNLSMTSGTTVARTIGKVDTLGNIDTTTALIEEETGSTNFPYQGDPTSVASDNGMNAWVAGTIGGVGFVTLDQGFTTAGGVTTTSNPALTNVNQVEIFDGQLYVSSSLSGNPTSQYDGIATVGGGLPTTNGQVITPLLGLNDSNSPSSYSFFFTQLSSTSSGDDTLYVADSATGITKFSLQSDGTWAKNNTVGTGANQFRGLTGTVSQTGAVTLYATDVVGGASQVVKLVDTSGYNAPINGSTQQIALGLTNESFRGVALAPMVTPNKPPTINAVLNPANNTNTFTFPPKINPEEQVVNLSGITDGDNDNGAQTVTISATSNNTALIPDPNISYNSPDTIGVLSYTPVSGATGTATITITVKDSGGTLDGGNDTTQITFNVVITTNNAPTINSLTNDNFTVPSNDQFASVNLSGITDGDGGQQNLTVTASSSNPAIVNPIVSYTNPNKTGSITYTPVTGGAIGTATITVTVQDDGGTAGGGVDTATTSFTVTVTPNNAPTLDPINPANITLPANSGSQVVSLTGIADGDGGLQGISASGVTATSNNQSLIPNPTITNFNPASGTATLTYTPVGNATGSATITVRVRDNGGTAGGGHNTVTRTFIVNISSVNVAPAINAIPDPAAIPANSGLQTINLSGISDSNNNTQNVTITAVSDNPGLIPNPFNGGLVVNYNGTAPASSTGTITYTPVAGQTGMATITVTLMDNGGVANGGQDTTQTTFHVVVTPNHAPTLSPITPNPLSVGQNAAKQTVNLTGISDGDNGTQTLTLSAMSDNPGVIPNTGPGAVAVQYTPGSTIGTLTFTPTGTTGMANITVTVMDNGGTPGVNTVTQTFLVNVTAVQVNNPPTINPINPVTIPANSGSQTVTLSNITDGDGGTQGIQSITAVSNTPGLTGPITVNYNTAISTTVTTLAGTAGLMGSTDATGSAARFAQPEGTAVDSAGNIYVADFINDTIRKITPAGVVTTLAGSAGQAGSTDGLVGVARFNHPFGVAVDSAGNVYVGDSGNDTIRKITPGGVVTTLAGSAGVAGSLDGTGSAARFNAPLGIAVDSAGNVYVADSNNDTIRKVTPGGVVSTLAGLAGVAGSLDGTGGAAQFKVPDGVAVDSAGNVYVADTGNNTIRKITPGGVVSTLAGLAGQTGSTDGTGSAARFNGPTGLTVDGAGNVYVSDRFNDTIRKITPAGVVTTLVGSAGQAGEVDGLGSAIRFNQPSGVALDIAGNVYVADELGPTIRKLSIPSGNTGTLTFTPVANQTGTATITVTVKDNGGVANGGNDTTTIFFTVTVTPNHAPTLATIPPPPAIFEVSSPTPETIGLSGISDGDNGTQTLTITAVSSNPALVNPVNVNYTSGSPTGSLTYTVQPGANGTATITVTVQDNGGTAGGGVNFTVRTFVVSVTQINQPPTINPINPIAIPENAGPQVVNLSGISSGLGDPPQTLTFSAISDNPALIPNPTFTYIQGSSTGTLNFTPTNFDSGTATITVTVKDNGGVANGGNDTTSFSFTVTVAQVNQPPTLNPIGNPSPILENSGPQTITLTGITVGFGNPPESLFVSATSSNTALIPNPSVAYISPNTSGTLTYTPVANATGTATITVTVMNSGSNVFPNVNLVTQTFTVAVNPVNQPPTINLIPNPAAILENAPTQNVLLGGISAGPGESQDLTITATSSNPALIPNPTVSYTSPDALGALSYTPVLGTSGTAVITVTVMDNGGTASGGMNTTTRTFSVVVTPVNQPPTLDPIANPVPIAENSGVQTVALTGISAGAGESQALTVTASSSNTALIPTPMIIYNSPNASGTLLFTPAANQSGTALITVVVTDAGSNVAPNVNNFSRTFLVTVTPINQAPTLTAAPTATATAAINTSTNQVSGFTVTNGGSGYSSTNPPTVTITGGGGTGATGTAVVNANGVVTSITLNSGGLGYTTPPIVTIGPGSITILENAATQTVNLTGITAGPGESGQFLTVAATSSNPAVILNPTVSYTSPATTGTLTFTPLPNTSTTSNNPVMITVTVTDNGSSTAPNVNVFTRTFLVAVTPVNQAPTINPIAPPTATATASLAPGTGSITIRVTNGGASYSSASPPAVTLTGGTFTTAATATAVVTNGVVTEIDVTGGTGYTVVPSVTVAPPTLITIAKSAFPQQQSIALSGISAGFGDTGQTVNIFATSNNPGLIPNPSVIYSSPGSSGTLNFTPVANASGTAVITVTTMDNGGVANGGKNTTTQMFTVVVTAVNVAPTLDPINSPPPILVNSARQTIALTGITAGAGDTGQTLAVTATSSNTALIPNTGTGALAVTYTSPNATGTLAYTPVAGVTGMSTITVTVTDNGGTANGGTNTTTQMFTVVVAPTITTPIVTTSPGNLSYFQGQAATAIDPNLIVTDASGTNLIASATVQITANLNSSQDVLAFTNTAAITGSYDPSSGTLTLSGVDTAAHYQAALRSVTYFNNSANPTLPTRTVTFTVNDGLSSNNTGSGTRGINVIPIVVTTSPGSLFYTQGQAASAIDQNLTVSDSNSTTLASATVTLSTNFNSSEDVLGFVNTASITGVYDPTAGVLTLTGPDTVANFQAALRSVTYFNTSQNLTPLTRTVTFAVNDGMASNNTGSGTRGINLIPINVAPTLDSIPSSTINENAGLQSVNLTGITAGGGQSQILTVAASAVNVSNPGGPALITNLAVLYNSPNATGALTFTPAANTTGTAMITVTVSDNGSNVSPNVNFTTQTFLVTVNAVNQAPTLSPISNPPAIFENAAQQTVTLAGITMGAGDTNQTLIVNARAVNVSNPGGTPLISNLGTTYTSPNTSGVVTYTPTANTFGTALITVTVTDSGSNVAPNVNTVTQSFLVTVTPINQAPTLNVISPAQITINENSTPQPLTLSGISDGDGGTQVVNVFATSNNPALITPIINYTNPNQTATLNYTPLPNQNGTATITVTVMDNGGTANSGVNTTTQMFTVTVTPVNQQPTLNPIANPAAILENTTTPQTVQLSGITPGPGDGAQTVTVTAVSNNPGLIPNPISGGLAVSYANPGTTGSISYLPVPNTFGTATITVTVVDNGGTAGGGVNTITQTFTVTVTQVNQQPTLDLIANPPAILENSTTPQVVVLSGITAGTGESQALTVTAVSNDTGLIANPTVSYSSPNTIGTVSYIPVANASGMATITVTVTDSGGTANGGINAINRTFMVTVTPVNQAPTLNFIPNPANLPINSGTQSVSLSGITAGPGDTQNLTVTAAVTGGSNPALIPNTPAISYGSPGSNGTLFFTPAVGQTGTAVITVTVTDSGDTANGGMNTFSQSFTVSVGSPNVAPIVTVSSSALTYFQNSAPLAIAPGGVTVTDASPTLIGATAAITSNFVPGQDVLALSPNPQNGISGTYNASTGVLTLTGTASLAAYSAALGSVTYSNTSGNPSQLTRTVTFSANDGAASNNIGYGVQTVGVTAINVAPTLNPINPPPLPPITILENSGTLTVDLSGISAGGGQSQTLTLSATATPINTQQPVSFAFNYASPNTTGAVLITPLPNISGLTTITVTVTDSGGLVNGGVNLFSQSFLLNILPVNVAPTLAAIFTPAPILENTTAPQQVNLVNITAGGTEVQNLTVSAVSSNPALIPNPAINYSSPSGSGLLTYAPRPNTSGTATIIVTVTDDGGTANGGINNFSQSFVVVVTPVNQPPTLDPIPSPNAIPENTTAPQTINLSGITAGPGDVGQTLSVTATSSNTALVPNPSVSFVQGSSGQGSLTYTVVPGASGTATITVTVTDNGSNVAPNVNNFSRTFLVTVTPVNQPPTLNQIGSPLTILENAGVQTINLSGITAGPNESQTLTVMASSSNTGLIPNPLVTYSSPGSTGVLSFTPVANTSGMATITVTVMDDNSIPPGASSFSRTFLVLVTPVNQAPSLDPISDPAAIPENSGPQTINLTNISPGPGDTGQNLTITAVSNNAALIPNPSVTYTSPAAMGSLSYTPVANASGTAVITVTLTDDGGTANGGKNTFSETFTVTVSAVNIAPTLDPINPLSLPVNPGLQTVNLTGITAGGGAIQNLTVTAAVTSSSPSTLIGPITVNYTPNSTTGSLTFTPTAGQTGAATITVTVMDDGGVVNGGVDTFVRTFTVSVGHTIPVVTTTVTPLSYIQTVPPAAAAVDPGVTVSDPSSPTLVNGNPALVGASVAIVSNFTIGQDVLGFTNQNNIIGSYNAATGVLTLSGTDTVANYQTALRSVTYLNSSGNPSTLTRTITFTVNDGATISNTGSASRAVNVTQINVAPTINPIPNPPSIIENTTTPQVVNLSGITAGGGQMQNLTVSAVSNNPALIPVVLVNYNTPNTTGSLSYTPLPNVNGTALITVTVMDDGGTANGGINTTVVSFTVTVGSVNQAPTLDPIVFTNQVLENSTTPQIVNLTGIGPGASDAGQVLTVFATSSNPALIPNPAVTYPNPITDSTQGSLSFFPAPNASGTVVITVTVMDNGGTANGGVNTFTRTFTVTVTPVDQPPTLNVIPTPRPVFENATAPQTLPLSGISAGLGDAGQFLTITATSSNPAVIPNPTVTYTSPNTLGAITYTPVANASGTATITVKVMDNGGTAFGGINVTTRSFIATVMPVNQIPTLAPIASPPAILENSPTPEIVNLTGIAAGLGETQTLTVTATSSNTAVVPNPIVTYNSPDSTGFLSYSPVANTSGKAVITVTVTETGGTANGGVNMIVRTFTAVVTPVDQAPTLNVINNPAPINENAGKQTVPLAGITAGAGDAGQILSVTATSSNPALIPNPNVTTPNPTTTTDSVTYTPVPGASGMAVITVTVMDNGTTANGGINSVSQTFTVVVNPVNQQPTLDPIGATTATAIARSTRATTAS